MQGPSPSWLQLHSGTSWLPRKTYLKVAGPKDMASPSPFQLIRGVCRAVIRSATRFIASAGKYWRASCLLFIRYSHGGAKCGYSGGMNTEGDGGRRRGAEGVELSFRPPSALVAVIYGWP